MSLPEHEPGEPADPRRSAWLFAALAACFALLGAQVWRYWFLCDDAFISFRYARNLAQGNGLVFNPGGERVEGYSNFLWVLILAAGQWFGISPERAANPLSFFCGLLLFAVVIHHCWRETPPGGSRWWVLVPAVLLATNRSWAVWCTSGLETKLFELLVISGVLSSVTEMRAMSQRRPTFPYSALLFAGATLTRPDGLLFAACVMGSRLLIELTAKTLRKRTVATGALAFLLPVGAHYLFRWLYYHDIFPNTYYAKVGGHSWWSMGAKYLACFALEYAAVLWLPLLVPGAMALIRSRRREELVLFAAAIIPHAIYIAAIGGDHFEYRPVDVYLPLLFILIFHGAGFAARSRVGRAPVTAYVAVCITAGAILPELSHRDFPPGYRTGFPGLLPRDDYRTELIDSIRRPWVFALPGIKRYAILYNDLIYETSRQFVGLRQEEHKAFLATAVIQGRWLAELVRDGVLPADLHIAVDCVGAIPYYSNLRTLDRLGLTDAVVARQPDHDEHFRVMAHAKLAEPEYEKRIGVDLDAADRVHIILPRGHPRLLLFGHQAAAGTRPYVFARIGSDRYLVGTAVRGLDALQGKLPRLKLEPGALLVGEVLGADGKSFTPVPRPEQFGSPYDLTYFDQGLALTEEGLLEATLVHFECCLATNPDNPQAKANLPRLREFLAARRAR